MKKIFKYDFDNATGEVTMPQGAQVIRIDHVDDGFYKGHFLWAIVTVGDENIEQIISIDELAQIMHPTLSKVFIEAALKTQRTNDFGRIELRVKEKQTVSVPGYPVAAGEEDGKLYLYYTVSPIAEGDYDIAFYKTGQEIDLPVEDLRYIGLNRLWIIQELGLYTFVVKK